MKLPRVGWRRSVRERALHSFSSTLQEERLCLPGISSTRPSTLIFALCHTTREGFVFICTAMLPASPHRATSSGPISKNPRGAGSAVQID